MKKNKKGSGLFQPFARVLVGHMNNAQLAHSALSESSLESWARDIRLKRITIHDMREEVMLCYLSPEDLKLEGVGETTDHYKISDFLARVQEVGDLCPQELFVQVLLDEDLLPWGPMNFHFPSTPIKSSQDYNKEVLVHINTQPPTKDPLTTRCALEYVEINPEDFICFVFNKQKSRWSILDKLSTISAVKRDVVEAKRADVGRSDPEPKYTSSGMYEGI